jgi:Uma2 family endonuclease
MGTMPTSKIDKPRATYEDVLKAPPHKVAEIVDGELYLSPRPAAPHALAASVLGVDLGGPSHHGRGGPGGWWIVDEPELHLGDDIVVPDLAGWRRERMPEFPKSSFFTLPPDCGREGVGHAWLVNPESRTLEGYRRSERRWLLMATHSSDDRVRAEPFDAVELDLLPLWGETRPPAEPTIPSGDPSR